MTTFRTDSPRLMIGILCALAFCGAIVGGIWPSLTYGAIVGSIACAVAAILAAQLWTSRQYWSLMELSRNLPVDIARTLPAELHSMHTILRRFPECSIPTSPWSMRFSNLHAVVEQLDACDPIHIVEYGSGASTLVIGAWLREAGRGRLVSFEHDPAWAAKTRQYVEREGLRQYVEVLDAPLATVICEGVTVKWYSIDPARLPERIDFVLVDGPPAIASENGLSRLPAVETLFERLGEEAVVVLDDANRQEEQTILGYWLKRLPRGTSTVVQGPTGLAIVQVRAKLPQCPASVCTQ